MHIAVIPSRKNSKGFKSKNRLFFDNTADFLDNIEWIEKIIVSTDDPVIKDYANKRNYEIHDRPRKLAGSAVPIKDVFTSVISDMNITEEDILWLFYLPLLYRNRNDYEKSRKIIENQAVKSLCAFISARTHPFNCWSYDSSNKKLSQYIENDVFRRQDLPPAWMHHHYICCFKVKELPELNNELINSRTHPYFIDEKEAEKFVEVDTPQDYEKWKRIKERIGNE